MFPALWRFVLYGRYFQFSLHSVQLIVQLSQPGLLDLQLRCELGFILSQPRFLLRHEPQPCLVIVTSFFQVSNYDDICLLTQAALDFFQLVLKLSLPHLHVGHLVTGITQYHLFAPKSDYRIHLRRPPRRDIASHDRHQQHQQRGQEDRKRIGRLQSKE